MATGEWRKGLLTVRLRLDHLRAILVARLAGF